MRPLPPVRLAFGGVLLLRPELAVGSTNDDRARAAARLLGLRHVLQAAIIGPRHGPSWHYAGALVDGAHAVTMIALSARDERHRRLCLASAAAASALSVGGVLEAAWRPGR